MSDKSSSHSHSKGCCGSWNHTFAAWIVRLAAAALLIISGLDKFKSGSAPNYYALTNYYGTEAELAENKALKWSKIVNVIFQNSGLDNTDKVPPGVANFNSRMFAAFGQVLPFLLIGSGLLIAIGLLRSIAYFLGGMTWVSLLVGQTVLQEVSYMVPLLLFASTCVAGLLLGRHDRLTLDGGLKSIFARPEED